MESVYKSLILIEAKNLINTIKDNKEFRILVKELEYFVNLQEKNITNEVLDELQALMSRIKKLLELDKKVKEKEDIIKLYEEVSLYFKEQEIRKDDLERVIKDVRNVGGNVAGVVYNKIPVSSKKYNQTYYYSSNVTVQKNNQPDYEAERRKLQQRTQNALSQNSKRNGNHSETNNRNSQNTRQENTQVPKALRNNIDKDNWKKIIEEEKKDF